VLKSPSSFNSQEKRIRLPDEPRLIPFRGQAQRLPGDNPDNHTLRANAIQRMRELGHQGMQRRRGREWLIEWATLDEPSREEEHKEMWSPQEKESEMHSRQRYSLQIPDKGSATETRDLSGS
jgi:hypothetical protein